VEVAILSIFLLVAVGGLSSAVLSSLRLSRASEETALADEAARTMAGDLAVANFRDVFWMYNASADGPVGGVAPGANFDVVGLQPRSDDADGRVGRILFPTVPDAAGLERLREDVQDARMGMDGPLGPGRDLNGDGDALDDVTDDYAILPVRLVIEWTGVGGDRSHEFDLLLVQ
jgi:hypothetical protein